MHLFATTTAMQMRDLGTQAAIVETPSEWSAELVAER
jgi:hypothetical protein